MSGSDLNPSPTTEELSRMGTTVSIGHDAGNVKGADLVLVSSAVPPTNPEMESARRLGIPVMDRRQFFAQWTKSQKVIAVAGTHGKTTTSALITLILQRADLDPTFILGGVVLQLGTNAQKGKGLYWIIEADEYQRTFLGLNPRILVITNIEMDHPDYFRDLEDVYSAFRELATHAQEHLFLCSDDPLAHRLGQDLGQASVTTYGVNGPAMWRGEEIKANPWGGSDFRALRDGTPKGRFSLRIPGQHNVKNALAALAVAHHLGIDLGVAASALSAFPGVERRFQVKGEAAGVTIIDDYAHHPSEIRATLAAARDRYPRKRIWAVFQPHTYSRTKALLGEFASALAVADRVVVTDIYPAREIDDGQVHSRDLIDAMDHPHTQYIGDLREAAALIKNSLAEDDVLLTLGAGDIWKVGEEILAYLRNRNEKVKPVG